MVVLNVLLPGDEINWKFGLQSVGILVICNVCLSLNLCPRLIAVWKGDQEKYNHSLEEEMQAYIADKMREFKTTKEHVGSNSNSSSPRKQPEPKRAQTVPVAGSVTEGAGAATDGNTSGSDAVIISQDDLQPTTTGVELAGNVDYVDV